MGRFAATAPAIPGRTPPRALPIVRVAEVTTRMPVGMVMDPVPAAEVAVVKQVEVDPVPAVEVAVVDPETAMEMVAVKRPTARKAGAPPRRGGS